MISDIERLIEKLRNEEFGPGDPRTPSLLSRPGVPLSKENERKILEGELRNHEYLEFLREKEKNEVKKYWSDKSNLRFKLKRILAAMNDAGFGEERDLAEQIVIMEGIGDVLRRELLADGNFGYRTVEIDIPEKNQLYLSRYQTDLSAQQQKKLRCLSELEV